VVRTACRGDLGVPAGRAASDGAEALKRLTDGDFAPDLILCDLEMPGMDGFAFLKTVRSGAVEGTPASLPVIIISSHDDQDSVRRAAREGIDGYLVKPVTRRSLSPQITQVMQAYALLSAVRR